LKRKKTREIEFLKGNIGQDFQYLFDHENIGEIFFKGFDDEERDSRDKETP
jgi:hypothetical protein